MTTLAQDYRAGRLHEQVAVIPGRLACLRYEQLSNLTTAVQLVPPAGAKVAYVIVQGNAVRYRTDGTAPTSAVGMPLAVGTLVMFDDNIEDKRFIEQNAGAVLNIEYYG